MARERISLKLSLIINWRDRLLSDILAGYKDRASMACLIVF